MHKHILFTEEEVKAMRKLDKLIESTQPDEIGEVMPAVLLDPRMRAADEMYQPKPPGEG